MSVVDFFQNGCRTFNSSHSSNEPSWSTGTTHQVDTKPEAKADLESFGFGLIGYGEIKPLRPRLKNRNANGFCTICFRQNVADYIIKWVVQPKGDS